MRQRTTRYTKSLRCTLTPDERLQKADELAKAHQEVEAEELRQKQIKSDLKASLEAKKAQRSMLASVVASVVASGAEYRQVVVEQVFDYDLGVVLSYRTDSGEQIERRPMTEDERQMPLPA